MTINQVQALPAGAIIRRPDSYALLVLNLRMFPDGLGDVLSFQEASWHEKSPNVSENGQGEMALRDEPHVEIAGPFSVLVHRLKRHGYDVDVAYLAPFERIP